MVENFQDINETVVGNVSGDGKMHDKSQVSGDYEGDYDIPTKYAQGKW